MEQGHYDVSVAVAEQKLLPTLRDANPDAVFLADGFSCRTQASQLEGSHGIHLAELLRDGKAAATRAGFDAHVAKPVEPAEVLALVARLCGRVSA